MADQLKNILHFVAIPSLGTASLPHNLHQGDLALVPDYLDPNPKGLTVTADETNVTVTNTTAGPLDVEVLCESWHSIERAFGGVQNRTLNPQPYVSEGGGGGGGGSGAPMFLPGSWGAVSIPASADQDLQLAPLGLPGIVMQRAGSIVGISNQISDVITGGLVTLTVTKNGAPMTLSNTQTSIIQPRIGFKVEAVGIDTYVAGDLIGVHLATSPDFAKADSLSIVAYVEAMEAP